MPFISAAVAFQGGGGVVGGGIGGVGGGWPRGRHMPNGWPDVAERGDSESFQPTQAVAIATTAIATNTM